MAAGAAPSIRRYELVDGEVLRGTVVRLPQRGGFDGTRLFLRTDSGEVGIPATASRGHTVLERLLMDHHVGVGDFIAVTYTGKRLTADGERTYRDYRLEVDRAT